MQIRRRVEKRREKWGFSVLVSSQKDSKGKISASDDHSSRRDLGSCKTDDVLAGKSYHDLC